MRRPIRFLLSVLLVVPLGLSAAQAAELRGHGGPVRAIALSEDGETAFTGGFDGAAIVWTLDSGAARRVLRFHDDQVNAVAALPDGRFATGGADGRIAIWGKEGGAPARVLEDHQAQVSSLALSPDGKTLASGSWDRTIRLWPLDGGAPRVLEGHRDSVNAVAFLADGTLASAGYDATLRLWSADAAAPPAIFTLPSPLNTLAALPSGRLAAGCADGHLRVVDKSGKTVAEAKISATPITSLAASKDGRLIAAAGLKGAIAVLDAGNLAAVHNLVGPGLPVWSAAFTPDARFLLTGGTDGIVRQWDMATGEHVGAIVAGPGDPLAAFEGERGAEVFRACVACHTLSESAGLRAGPTLAGIFGRRIASLPDYPYSEALRSMDIVWTPQTVAELFRVGPAEYLPGTKMPQQTIDNPDDRAALVEFLQHAAEGE
jgi:cytochrome c